mgnify:CR=1 FL=1
MTPPVEEVDKVWVFFTDKDTTLYDPFEFLDSKAIERRCREGISVYDITDVPVNQAYVSGVESITKNNRAVSRWFNAMCCLATENEIRELKNLSYVQTVKITNRPLNWSYVAEVETQEAASSYDLSKDQRRFAYAQLRRMSGGTFKANKITGKGVRIAIFDIGFKSYLTNPAFDHLRASGRIKMTYDFVKKKTNVDVGGSHGTEVMSCIGGKIGEVNLGLATGSEYILARTETHTEFYSEEENWLAAAEWADKNGADIINSSLGYTYHRYFREDMDGEHSLVAKAANMAASKGILVVNSAGNEGSGSWKIIGTPADADSVLSIGGIALSGLHTSFSSFGPTRDKRLKPNVTAYGHVIASGPKGLTYTQGTSFSSPLIAGFAACARQTRPAYKTMALFREIEKSGDLYPYFDYAHGYGVPQATAFFKMPSYIAPTFTFENKGDRYYIKLKSVDKTSLMRGDSTDFTYHKRSIAFPNFVFYHIENKNGYLDKYFVVNPHSSLDEAIRNKSEEGETSPMASEGPLVVKKSEYAKPFILRVFYKGYVQEIQVK